MSYPSIDALQRTLSEQVFSYTQDAKKAAGRALGTMVETVFFYLLREWGFNKYISIERGLAEYGNPDIKHNVEFTMHPLKAEYQVFYEGVRPITSTKILKLIDFRNASPKNNSILLDTNNTLKNACVIAESNDCLILASIAETKEKNTLINIFQQYKKPYAMFECKRVGVEEGSKKGPQTIEKAKQGAYVAKSTSALQKIRNERGELYGLIYENGSPIIRPYTDLLHIIINGDNSTLLKEFTLSVGIVSNHGNWFTAENMNKELKVLAQSYDWLLFLSDRGLAQFITDLLLSPQPTYRSVQKAFLESYAKGKKGNVFTKSKMNYDAHCALIKYFHENLERIESWFNIIVPSAENIRTLKQELDVLNLKKWSEIL